MRPVTPPLVLVLLLAARYAVADPTRGVVDNDLTVLFSPDGGCEAAIVAEITGATQSLDVLAYNFTSVPITKAVIDAHRRGVAVRVVLDRTNKGGKYSAATPLFNAGIKVSIDTKHPIAHNKVILVDGKTIVTGSYNFSKAAEERNSENVLILRDRPKVFAAYQTEFVRLLALAVPYTGVDKATTAPSPRP